jgi:hypothetical protein
LRKAGAPGSWGSISLSAGPVEERGEGAVEAQDPEPPVSPVAWIQSPIWAIRDRFSIDVEDGDDMKAHGNVVDHEYLINNHSHLHANPHGSDPREAALGHLTARMASAPEISTPVAPPPTTANVSHASRDSRSPARSACSNAP